MSGQRLVKSLKKKQKNVWTKQIALIQIYIICLDLFFFDIFGVQFLIIN